MRKFASVRHPVKRRGLLNVLWVGNWRVLITEFSLEWPVAFDVRSSVWRSVPLCVAVASTTTPPNNADSLRKTDVLSRPHSEWPQPQVWTTLRINAQLHRWASLLQPLFLGHPLLWAAVLPHRWAVILSDMRIWTSVELISFELPSQWTSARHCVKLPGPSSVALSPTQLPPRNVGSVQMIFWPSLRESADSNHMLERRTFSDRTVSTVSILYIQQLYLLYRKSIFLYIFSTSLFCLSFNKTNYLLLVLCCQLLFLCVYMSTNSSFLFYKVQLFCSHDSMTVSLNTIDPFNGRLYSKEDPNTCESMGRSSTNTVLSLPFHPRSTCGVREEVRILTILTYFIVFPTAYQSI